MSKHETQELLELSRRHLSLDEMGVFTWSLPTSRRVVMGHVAGTLSKDGYIVIQIGGRSVPAHRLAWAWSTGWWPKQDIDHIDGVRTNNRPSNLRDVPRRTNMENRKGANPCNATGVLGVSATKFGTFKATITVNRSSIYLGSFKTKCEASDAYLAAKRKLHAGCTI